MAEKSIFEQIKQQNGEHFAKAIRGYFNIPGIVDVVKYAGRNAEPIIPFLGSLKKIRIEETGVYQDPLTLLNIAGYDAYYVTNLGEQNRIKRYYASATDLMMLGVRSPGRYGEELCTFRDPNRFRNYHIIHAVKKNVDQIKRKDFIGKEERDDAYGSSVISIQILKAGGFISIKNRYNHTVPDADNTFGSNPDKIIPGLASALRHHFQTDFSPQAVQLPEGYTFINGQLIQYNDERDNIYFGSDFYVKDGRVHHLKSHEIMLDSYIFDLRTKKLIYPGSEEEDSAFKKAFLHEIKGHKVILKKDKDGQHLFIRRGDAKDPNKEVEILTVKDGCITALNLPTTKKIGNYFLFQTKIKSLNAPNLVKIGESCFCEAKGLEQINIPVLREIGNDCFREVNSLKSLNAPVLTKLGSKCFYTARSLKTLNTPNLEVTGPFCFSDVCALESLSLHKLTEMKRGCFIVANSLKSLDLPVLTEIQNSCFREIGALETVNIIKLKRMERCCFEYPRPLKTVNLPRLTEMGEFCFYSANSLETLNLQALTRMGRSCFQAAGSLKSLYLPALTEMEGDCFKYVPSLETLEVPTLKDIGIFCFDVSRSLKSFYAPLLEMGPVDFLSDCPDRERLLLNKNQNPKRSGISKMLYITQNGQKNNTSTLITTEKTRISRHPQNTNLPQSTQQSYTFLRRLRDWILPQR